MESIRTIGKLEWYRPYYLPYEAGSEAVFELWLGHDFRGRCLGDYVDPSSLFRQRFPGLCIDFAGREWDAVLSNLFLPHFPVAWLFKDGSLSAFKWDHEGRRSRLEDYYDPIVEHASLDALKEAYGQAISTQPGHDLLLHDYVTAAYLFLNQLPLALVKALALLSAGEPIAVRGLDDICTEYCLHRLIQVFPRETVHSTDKFMASFARRAGKAVAAVKKSPGL